MKEIIERKQVGDAVVTAYKEDDKVWVEITRPFSRIQFIKAADEEDARIWIASKVESLGYIAKDGVRINPDAMIEAMKMYQNIVQKERGQKSEEEATTPPGDQAQIVSAHKRTQRADGLGQPELSQHGKANLVVE